uniref:Extended synaptotagmin-2-A n=1 Tax=Rhizophora mucronata TaxID=61149 RepID=A0A2P2PUL6_RHIMU
MLGSIINSFSSVT